MFQHLVDAFKTQMNLGIVVVIILSLVNLQQTNTLRTKAEDLYKNATTEYAFTVVAYELKDAKDERDVIAQVIEWRNKNWGAQIGAINVVCRVDPKRMHQLMDPSTAIKACRLSGFS